MSEDEPLTITKKQLVNRIADQTRQTKVVVKGILQQFLDEIIDELSRGNRLEFREFGVFEVRERAARKAQNPRTLEKVEVPAKRVVKFKVGRTMRERVCEEDRPVPLPRPRIDAAEARPARPARPAPAVEERPAPKAPPQAPPSKPDSPF
jgi:integration host factor subunit beta